MLFDTFAGIPPPRTHRKKDAKWAGKFVATKSEVASTFARFGLRMDGVELVEGNFSHSLPRASFPHGIAVLRFDADTYDATYDVLTYLYPHVSPGGVVVVDDIRLSGCREALFRYRSRHRIRDPLMLVRGRGRWKQQFKVAFWVKGSSADASGCSLPVSGCVRMREETEAGWKRDE